MQIFKFTNHLYIPFIISFTAVITYIFLNCGFLFQSPAHAMIHYETFSNIFTIQCHRFQKYLALGVSWSRSLLLN